MSRAPKKCSTCPFRGSSVEYQKSCAHIPSGDWPCHTLDMHGDIGIQCRGHWQAVRKFGGFIGPYPEGSHPFSEGFDQEVSG